MFEGMAKAEQEQEQRAFRPGAERGRPRRGDQHQRVDLKPAHSQIIDRLANGEEAAQNIGDQVAGERQPGRCPDNQFLDREADAEDGTAAEREEQLGVRSEDTAMTVVVSLLAVIVFARTMIVTRVIVVRGLGSGRVTIGNGAADGGFVGAFPVELDLHTTTSSDIGFQYSRHGL
ncbi:hypothetical protein SPHINGOT1_620051 [Sphingomonas sp. T1]|nr:hypothetical protein SPHINGOT1_620051 [Sphingomonas sp. T1]